MLTRLGMQTILAPLAAGALLIGSAPGVAAAAAPATASGSAAAATQTAPPCNPVFDFRARDFSAPTTITNQWLPLRPGAQLVLEGTTSEGRHTIVMTVTDLTKPIAGVRTLVVWDRDYQDGQLAESELAFFAQDDRGNVWSMGEYPEEWEDGELVGAPDTWIAHRDGARPGLAMLGSPRLGTGWYLQGWAHSIEFLDCAKVFQVDQTVSVPTGTYHGVLVTSERSPLEPGSGTQRKFYAAGVGNIKVTAVGDKEAETLVLTSSRQLTAREMSQTRDAVMRMDRRGHRVSYIYSLTQPVAPLR